MAYWLTFSWFYGECRWLNIPVPWIRHGKQSTGKKNPQIPFSAPETTHAWREPSLSRLRSPRMENWKHLGFLRNSRGGWGWKTWRKCRVDSDRNTSKHLLKRYFSPPKHTQKTPSQEVFGLDVQGMFQKKLIVIRLRAKSSFDVSRKWCYYCKNAYLP